MASLELQMPPRRAWLRGWSLAMAAVALILGCGIGLLTGSISAPLVAGPISLGVILVGVLRPGAMRLPYRAWNRLTRVYAGLVRGWTIAVCYFVVIAPASRFGSSLELDSSGRSRWRPKSPLALDAYGSEHAGPSRNRGRGWIRTLRSWSMTSGRSWAASLLPFLIVLSWLEAPEEHRVPSEIYTLF